MPGFRAVIHRVQVVNGETHHHLHLLSERAGCWSVCGILLLHPDEWARFNLICEVVGIEFQDGVPSQAQQDPNAA